MHVRHSGIWQVTENRIGASSELANKRYTLEGQILDHSRFNELEEASAQSCGIISFEMHIELRHKHRNQMKCKKTKATLVTLAVFPLVLAKPK